MSKLRKLARIEIYHMIAKRELKESTDKAEPRFIYKIFFDLVSEILEGK
jgi:hypothetical protein